MRDRPWRMVHGKAIIFNIFQRPSSCESLVGMVKRSPQIIDDIFCFFEPDGEPDAAGVDATLQLFCGGDR